MEEGKAKTWGRRIVSGTLICLTGGVALSALDDLSIYHSCSRFASLLPLIRVFLTISMDYPFLCVFWESSCFFD